MKTLKTVVVSGARSLAALDIARALTAQGIRVIATDSFRYPPTRASRSVARYARVPAPLVDPPRFATGVAELLATEAPELWIPTCEEVFHLAHLKHTRGVPIPLFAPAFAHLIAVHDKYKFAKLAELCGLAPSETITLRSSGDVASVAARSETFVFKPSYSRFATRVLIQPPASIASTIAPTPADPWVAQTYLPGEEICTYAIARGGEVLLHTAYRPLYRAGRGAGVYYDPALEPDIAPAVATLVKRLEWTGQIAFDFRRDAAGDLKVIECNPRATSGVHLTGPRDLANAIGGATQYRPMQSRRMIAPAMIVYALLPAVRERRAYAWRADYQTARDVAAVSGDKRPAWMQFAFLAEVMATAISTRLTLQQAATRDIEWNTTAD